LIGLLISLAILGLRGLGFLESLELAVHDCASDGARMIQVPTLASFSLPSPKMTYESSVNSR